MDLSIVISLYNEQESLRELVEWITESFAKSPISDYQYEILMIDDGSNDGSWETIKNLSKEYPTIRGISFRRNYGKSAALQVGFQAAKGDIVVDNVRSEKGAYGYDALLNRYTDMFSAGIVDPAKVTRSALQNAASVAGMLLTTECAITDIPEPPAQAPAAPGMDGMGGMY